MKENVRHLDGNATLTLENAVKGCAVPGKQSHKRAVEWVYKRYFGYLFAIAIRYVRHREDAEELVNESFMRIFSNIGSFTGEGGAEQFERMFKGWISRICVNVSIDFLRSRKVYVSLDDDGFQESELPRAETSDQLDVQDILQLLARLPEVQRLIFNLFEVEGYNHEEIAVMLDIPESTCRTYLMRAKKKMRAWCEQNYLSVR